MKKYLRIVSLFLILALSVAILPNTAYAENSSTKNSEMSSLDAFREIFYGTDDGLLLSIVPDPETINTIYVDDSDIIHRPQEYPDLELSVTRPFGAQKNIVESGSLNSGPFELNDTRPFRIAKGSGAIGTSYIMVGGKLLAQGENTNVWILDDEDYHMQAGNVHSDSSCALCMVDEALAQEIADEFDGIYSQMTDPHTGFGAHGNVIFEMPYSNLPELGDLGNDGKINILLYDIDAKGSSAGGSYAAGFFWSADMQTGIDYNALDMFHMDIAVNYGYRSLTGNGGDKMNFYGTLAHEFQHLLFYMYFGVYGGGAQYTWINEALSGLANVFYTVPGSEIISTSRFRTSAPNPYMRQGISAYGDFVNFNQSFKNYGMGYLHSMLMYKKTNKTYGSKIYEFFRSGSWKGSGFWTAYDYVQNNSMNKIIGEAFGHVLDIEPSSIAGEEIFANMYYVFMENFAADGGVIQSGTSTYQSYRFLSDTASLSNLWGVRPLLGVTLIGADYTPIPSIGTGGSVLLQGYAGTNAKGATHEMLYKIGKNTSDPILTIQMPNISGMEYYVVIPNDLSANGAAVYHMAKGSDNNIDTNGKDAYLFVSTIYQDISTSVDFSWKSAISTTATVTGAIRSYNPNNEIRITLTRESDGREYAATIAAAAGSGQVTQDFAIENVEAGTYTLTVAKAAHTRFTVTNVVVDGDVAMGRHARDEIKVMTLVCGDLNGDGYVNPQDLQILTSSLNFNKGSVLLDFLN